MSRRRSRLPKSPSRSPPRTCTRAARASARSLKTIPSSRRRPPTEPVAEEPVELTTEDLYARRPRKRKVAQDDTVEPEASVDAAPGDSQKGGEQ